MLLCLDKFRIKHKPHSMFNKNIVQQLHSYEEPVAFLQVKVLQKEYLILVQVFKWGIISDSANLWAEKVNY